MDNDFLEDRPNLETTNKRVALLSIAGVLFLLRIFQWYSGDPENNVQLLDLVFAVFFGIAIFLWCQIDAEERGVKVGTLFAIGVLLFGPFAVMYYFFRTRGFQRGLISIGWMLLFGLVILIASLIELNILANISDRMGILKDA
ncbi:MAG: hypothetical protein ABI878_09985 [Acidobacteriota bacterium]